MKNKKKVIISIVSIILIAVITIGAYLYDIESQNNKGNTLLNSNNDKTTSSQEDNIDWSTYKTYDLALNNKTEAITEEGVYNVTGTISNGSIKINTDGNVKLILNDVSIANNSGPAILVENSKNTYIELKGTNKITATTSETEDGAIFSHDDLFFEGLGSLTITSNYDGIVSKDDLTFYNGSYAIKAESDGIKGKDSATIKDGTYNITAQEGIEATYVKIEGGTINIIASDDGINATNKSTKYDVLVEISGGVITIKMGQGDTDAIDSNGKLYITGGTIDITANSPFDYDGESKFTGGTVTVNGEKVSSLQNQMMGGPGGDNIQGGPDRKSQDNRIKEGSSSNMKERR